MKIISNISQSTKEIFSESGGKLSLSRLVSGFIVITIMIVWAIVSLHHMQLQSFQIGDSIPLAIAAIIKIGSKPFEISKTKKEAIDEK